MDSELRSRDKGGYDRARYPPKAGVNKKRERERDKIHGRPKYNEPSGFQPTKILSKPPSERKTDPIPSMVPGTVSLLTRDPSHNTSSVTMTTGHTAATTSISSTRDVGATATTPSVTAVNNTDDIANTKLGMPATPIKPIETVPHVIKSRHNQNRTSGSSISDNFSRSGKKRSTGDGLSSSPSNFTPLYPSRMAGGREGYGRDGGVILSRGDPSMFGSVSDAQHCVRIIDESLAWDDRGADSLMDQPDYLVVGCLGMQGVGKSTIMSILAGSKTGSGRPYLFRPQSKDIQDCGGYQTVGVDMVVTGERIILLDTQPILSSAMLEQFTQNEPDIPDDLSPETYLEIQSLQLAILLLTICHVIIVVIDTLEADTVFRFIQTAESLKPSCISDSKVVNPDKSELEDYYPQIVFAHNFATPDDFQPHSIKQAHSVISCAFYGSKLTIDSGVSLLNSGLIPVGSSSHAKENSINLQLFPTNQNAPDSFGPLASRPEKLDTGLNPVLALLPHYTGHPTFQLLSETFRNQIFAMTRPPLTQRQMTEREWFDNASKTWTYIKKSNQVLLEEYNKLLQNLPE